MTPWEQVETHAMTYIKNDLPLDADLRNRPPVFYNRMERYMRAAIPRFNRPPFMAAKLAKYTAPRFTDAIYTADGTETQIADVAKAVIPSGVTGYDICCAARITQDRYGDTAMEYLTVTDYDSATGDITLAANLEAGDTIELDFYASGSFEQTLNDTEIDILAFAIYAVWEKRFDNDAIERQSKIRDSSFTTISEASQTNAGTARQTAVDNQLFQMIRMYEQNYAYGKVVNKLGIFR